MTELHALSPEEKVAKAIELGKQGLTRQEIADTLYSSPDKKNRLGGLRKLMARKGYVWDEEQSIYVVMESDTRLHNKQQETEPSRKVVQTNNNKQHQYETNSNKEKQPVTDKQVKHTTDIMLTDAVQGPFLTKEDRVLLQELLKVLREQSGASEGHVEASSSTDVGFTDFTGYLHGSTMQLYSEVWNGLDEYCKKHRVSKKAVVNQAIWDYLKKWGQV